MKIMIVGQYPPPFHGSNVMAQRLSLALENLRHKVIFINKSFSKDIETVGQFSFRKLLRVPVLTLLFSRAAIARRPHLCIYFIAVAKSAFLVDAFLLILLRFYRVPYILRFGGKGFSDLAQQNLFWRSIVSVIFGASLGGVVKGNRLKSDVNAFIPDARLVPIPNTVASSHIQLVNRRDKRNRIVQILFFANLIPSKGPLEFLKASKIVLETTQDVRFVLAGAKWCEDFQDQLKCYIVQNGLEPFVDMPGGVYEKDKEILFASSHIFVFPTYYDYETFGLVNLEAMRAGLPVISSSEGAIPEVVQDGITGFIVNPRNPKEIANRILRLAQDPEFRERMGRAGRERFEKEYSFEAYMACWDRTIQFFRDLPQKKYN